jgi:integrase
MLKLSLHRHDDAEVSVLDRRGYYRSPVTFPAFHQGVEPANKGKKYPPEPLTPAEVYALLNACGRGPCGRRNRALIMCFWRTGLRCSEALALMPKDVDLDNGRVAVLHGKGDRARVVALDPAACAVLERWARERRQLGLTGRHPFFCVVSLPSRGLPMRTSYVRELLHDLADKAGIEKRVHPHGLRHTYASYLLEQGVPIHHIRRMLGHSSLAITERYADHINPAEVVEGLRSLSWPSAPR